MRSTVINRLLFALLALLIVFTLGASSLTNLATQVTGILAIAHGGNGTSSPSLTAGANVTLSGSWPNYTINATNSGGGISISSANYRRWASIIMGPSNNVYIGEIPNGFAGNFTGGSTVTNGTSWVATTCPTFRQIQTNATTNSDGYISNGLAQGWRDFLISRNPSFKFVGAVSSTTNTRAWLALTDQNDSTQMASATPAGNWVAFRYDTSAGDTHWNACTSASGSSGCVDTGITPVANTCSTFRIDITSGTSALFTINNSAVATISTHLPAGTVLMGWVTGLRTLAAAAEQFTYSQLYWDEDGF